MHERCVEATLAIERDASGVITSARWSCDGETGYPRLDYDPQTRRGTLRYSVEVDRFEAGTLHEEAGHPWGDSSESQRQVDAATWLDEALAELRTRMVEHLSGKRKTGFSEAEAREVVAYIETHVLAAHFVGNTDASWQPFVALGKKLSSSDPDAALARFQQAARVVAGNEQKLAQVIVAAQDKLGPSASARVRAGLSQLPFTVALSVDDLLAIGNGDPCAGAWARLRARIASFPALTTTWGTPSAIALARARWRSLGKPNDQFPNSFGTFLQSRGTLLIRNGTQTICELYEPERWRAEQLSINDNNGKPRKERLLVFGELLVDRARGGSPRSAVYLLGEWRGSEPQWISPPRAAHRHQVQFHRAAAAGLRRVARCARRGDRLDAYSRV